jgi:hypothetical protein
VIPEADAHASDRSVDELVADVIGGYSDRERALQTADRPRFIKATEVIDAALAELARRAKLFDRLTK